jgi:D-amino-acid dehydrogenase
MKIAVIGAGIQGICTAYELADLGHRVHVFDRNGSAAEEASFANGSLLSAYTTASWLDQMGLGQALRSRLQKQSVLQWQRVNPSVLHWAHQARKLRHGPVGVSRRKDLHELAQASRQHLSFLSNTLRYDMDQGEGVLVLMRNSETQARWSPLLQEMAEWGIEVSTFDAEQAAALEPALRRDTALSQAVWLKEDSHANCRQFGLLLKTTAEDMGVTFHFNTEVLPFHRQAGIRLLRTVTQDYTDFDAVVLCAGKDLNRLLHPLGVRPALQYLHGYSVSAAVREPLDAPKSAVFDAHHQVSIARMGQRVRIAGAYTLGKDVGSEQRRLEMLYKVLDDWFPGAARTHDNPQIWHSTVACTVDGLPLIGKTPIPGLWLNAAHGLSGWTLACGSARLVAQQISGRPPMLAPEKFSLARFLK